MATETCPKGKWTESTAPVIQKLDLKNFVDRVYVINLKRRPDRLKTFLERLETYGWPFKEPIVYPAIEGDVVGVPEEYQSGGGAYGCRMSHLRILQDCLMEGVGTVMILEDDAEIAEGFSERVEEFLRKVPDDWQGIMLGGQHHAPPKETGIPGVVRVQYAQRTHAYIARREYMRALQRRWGNCTVHIDWAMKDWQHQHIVYAPDPWLIGQAGGRSDIRGAVKPTEWWTPSAPKKPAALPPGPRPILVLRTDSRQTAEELCRRGWHLGYWRDGNTGYDNGLRDIASKASREERIQKLQEWAKLLWREAEEAGCVVALWHPEIRLDEVQAAWSPVYEITARTPEEAEAQLPEPWKTFLAEYIPPNQPPVVLLKAPDPVPLELEQQGWQCVRLPDGLVEREEEFRRWLIGQIRSSARSGQVLALYGPDLDRLPPLPERVEKQTITGHSAKEVMNRFFGNMNDFAIKEQSMGIEISGNVGLGTIGLEGNLGYNTEEGGKVILPPGITPDQIISSHAPSTITINLPTPYLIAAIGNATFNADRPIRAWINDHCIGLVSRGWEITPWIDLPPGRYTLRFEPMGEKHAAHTLWLLKKSDSAFHNRLALITVGAYPHDMPKRLRYLFASAAKHKLLVHVSEANQRFNNLFTSKIERLYHFIEALPSCYTHILFVDAEDCFIQADEGEILSCLDSLIISTEDCSWPVPTDDWKEKFLNGTHRFPNSGCIGGPRAEFQEALGSLIQLHYELKEEKGPQWAHRKDNSWTNPWMDQYLWQIAIIDKRIKVHLDTEWKLCACLTCTHRLPTQNDHFEVDGQLIMKRGGKPPVVHLPGPGKAYLSTWATIFQLPHIT